MENNSEKTIQPFEENTKKNKSLLGFRTDKVWKKLISISYLAFCVLLQFSPFRWEEKDR